MATNNTALYDAVIAGIASSNNAWLFDPIAGDYAGEANVAAVIATEVDAQIPVIATGATISQRILLESIAKGVMSGRQPQSLTQAEYSAIADAMAALFVQMNTKLQNNSSGAVPLPSITQNVFVSALYGSDVTGDGSEDNPYLTIAHAQLSITDASAAKIYQIILLPGEYIENVVLKAFTGLVGSNPNQGEYSTTITGDVTLGATFAVAASIGWVTNVDITGTVILDYAAVVSVNGSVIFTNCLLESNVTLTQGTANYTYFFNVVYYGDFFQNNGNVEAYANTFKSVEISSTIGTEVYFLAYNTVINDDLTLNQNASIVLLSANLFNSTVVGDVIKNASATNTPEIVNLDYGAIKENVDLNGAAAALDKQMRIVQQFSIPGGTAIAATSTTPIALAVTPGLLGTTPIENMCSYCSLVGTDWTELLVTHNCSVTFQYVNPNAIIVHIYNPGAGFNTAQPIGIQFAAYLPSTAP